MRGLAETSLNTWSIRVLKITVSGPSLTVVILGVCGTTIATMSIAPSMISLKNYCRVAVKIKK
jgi:hypothetical protein